MAYKEDPLECVRMLNWLLVRMGGIDKISEQLKKPDSVPGHYSYSYVHQVLSGKVEPGDPFIEQVEKLYQRLHKHRALKKRKPRPHFAMAYFPNDKETKDKIVKAYTPEERGEILKRQYIEDHGEI